MNSDLIISDFKQRKLHIDFLEMSLVQNKDNEAISYKGKGFVQLRDNDILTFKIYANKTSNTDYIANLNRQNKIKSGELYTDDSFYTLSGTAADGTVWKAERVLPNFDWHNPHKNPIVHGELSSIMGGKLLPDTKSLEMHFFEKADLPVAFHQVKFKAADCEFHVEGGDDNFLIRAKSDAPLPKHFAMRVEEALRFLLAQSVTPRVIIQPRSIMLTSTTRKSLTARLGPPISRGSAAFHDGSWLLFETYLLFVIGKTNVENWHPCSGYLHMAREASANSLDAWAIGLGVAVEGLASLIDIDQDKTAKDARKTENECIKKLQDFIVKQVSSQKRFKKYVERIRSLVAGLTSVRAIDRMKWLSEHNGADPAHVKAWQKLRNRGVHPATKRDFDVSSLDFQQMIDELHCVQVLLYHITFYVIGYQGPYTDYSVRNFPMNNYPLLPLSKDDEGAKTQV